MPIVQRVESASPVADPRNVEGEKDSEAPTVDVDALAREVYAALRRRLAADWERGRGR